MQTRLLHHIIDFNSASCERKPLLKVWLVFGRENKKFPPSADNVGILCTMIHFSGVLIGKKTDKFYLLRRVKKVRREGNLWDFVMLCRERASERREKVFYFYFPCTGWQEINDNIRLRFVCYRNKNAREMVILNSIFLPLEASTCCVTATSVTVGWDVCS